MDAARLCGLRTALIAARPRPIAAGRGRPRRRWRARAAGLRCLLILFAGGAMIAGPGGQVAAAGRGHLRASHADREQTIDSLKAAFVQGRLTKDEFDARVGQTLISRTYADRK